MRPAHLILIALLGLTSMPADALRCGNSLVREGMSRHEVRKRCGNPVDSSVRYETFYRKTARDESVAYDIEIEEWIYDFGRNSFDRRLIFINGRLYKEEIAE
jgi:DNA mismatch repair ATPase MutL